MEREKEGEWMKSTIFSKALKLLPYLKKTQESELKEYYEFDYKNGRAKNYITLTKEARGTKIDCTCKSCSTYGEKYLCSHKISVIIFKTKSK